MALQGKSMTDLAVLYLARLGDGFDNFEKFAASYRKHAAGQSHDLILVAKGFDRPEQLAALEGVFSDIPHSIIELDDDVGLDIHAYHLASLKIRHPIVCFLNTYTQLRADRWLQKLYGNFTKPGVGIVGATGSYESIYSSFKLTYQVCWLMLGNPPAFSPVLTRQFKWLFPHDGAWVKALSSPYSCLKLLYEDHRKLKRPSIHQVAKAYEDTWTAALQPGAGFAEIRDIPIFPNPHIRSNAFMLSREDFLSCKIDGNTKYSCLRFESGPEGLTAILRRRGLRPLVVGANGVGYEIDKWPISKCFRSGNQSNLLAEDNQTSAFNNISRPERSSMLTMTWGGYRSRFLPRERTILGVTFTARRPIQDVLIERGHYRS